MAARKTRPTEPRPGRERRRRPGTALRADSTTQSKRKTGSPALHNDKEIKCGGGPHRRPRTTVRH